MSRIPQAPVQPGDIATAAAENARFDAFSLPSAIDAANVRDAAFDLPQFGTGCIMLHSTSEALGTGDWRHSSPNTVASFGGAGAATKNPVLDAVGAETYIGPIAWTMAVGDILRVYFDLSVRPRYEVSSWLASTDGKYWINDGAGGSHAAWDGGHCWLFSLQWDITSAALVNWVEVSGQTAYGATAGARTGGQLSDSPASFPVPAWVHTTHDLDRGRMTSIPLFDAYGVRWTSVSGTWYYVPAAPITIYGLRVVIHGLYHGGQATNVNYLLVDPAVEDPTVFLEYDAGQITALHQRMT